MGWSRHESGYRGAIPIVILAVAAGCAANAPLRPDGFPVSSDPPGATVYAAGKTVGVTPLVVRQRDVFPTAFDQGEERMYGTIELRKEGCRDNVVRVNTSVVAKGIHVMLDCGQAKPAPPAAAPSEAGSPTPRERLLRLQELRDQGLVTDEEYREIRKRILEGL